MKFENKLNIEGKDNREDFLGFNFTEIKLGPESELKDDPSYDGEITEQVGNIQLLLNNTNITLVEKKVKEFDQGRHVLDSYEFDVFNKHGELIAGSQYTIDFSGPLFNEFSAPVVEMCIAKGGDRNVTDEYPGFGRILIAKTYQFLFSVMNQNFYDLITRSPGLSDSGEDLSKEEWLDLFGEFLNENSYKQVDDDKHSQERWVRYYRVEDYK